MIIFPTRPALVSGIAEHFVSSTVSNCADRGRCTIALSGGSTPQDLYRLLAQEPFRLRVPWKQVMLFWGDERAVPPDHPDSNYRMVREALLEHVPIPESNVFRIKSELSPQAAAQSYNEQLIAAFDGQLPRFDITLLGMGGDGHTASLFPGTGAVAVQDKYVTEVEVSSPKSWRISITLPIINNSREIIFMISGDGKREMLRRIRALDTPDPHLPASMIAPASGMLYWMVDRDAAGI